MVRFSEISFIITLGEDGCYRHDTDVTARENCIAPGIAFMQNKIACPNVSTCPPGFLLGGLPCAQTGRARCWSIYGSRARCVYGVSTLDDKRPVHYTVFLVAVNVRVAVK